MDEIDLQQAALAAEAQRNEEIRRRDLLNAVDFGLQVQAFLDGPIGNRILTEAENELQELAAEVWTLNVDYPDHLIRLRIILARSWILNHWQVKFAEYIKAGRDAEDMARAEDA